MADKAEKKRLAALKKAEAKAEKERAKAAKKEEKERKKAMKKGGKASATPDPNKSVDTPSPASSPAKSGANSSNNPSPVKDTPNNAAATDEEKVEETADVPVSDNVQSLADVTEAEADTTPSQENGSAVAVAQVEETPAVALIMEENSEAPPPAERQMLSAAEAGAPSGMTRNSKMRRSSMHGAPRQLLPSQEKLAEEQSDVIAEEQKAIVEEEADQSVGDMLAVDARRTAGYLSAAVRDLRDRMIDMYDKGSNRGYQLAYQRLAPVGRDQPVEVSHLEENKLKNRYGNISPYDAHRVKLTPMHNDPNTDYINASWVDGYKYPNQYIASQGPIPNSFISHWRMIWEMKIETIVMVTHEVEQGRMKCHRYWPDPTSSPPVKKLNYGHIMVHHIKSVPHKHFIVRTFTVEFGGEERTLKQFAYTSWPDHGVPLTTAELLGFRNAVNHSITNTEVPILIHCSAGVGRTGTYIAIDTLVKQALDMGGRLEIDRIIAEMRMRRNFMVQTEVQYMFIFRAVLDCCAELLSGEFKKAEKQTMKEAEEAELKASNEAAQKAKEISDKKEREEIESAKRELASQEGASASNAAAVIGMSIKDRLNLLADAEQRWIENYKTSLAEWAERNQFEAEEYDLTSSLTPVQSRLEALKQKGMTME